MNFSLFPSRLLPLMGMLLSEPLVLHAGRRWISLLNQILVKSKLLINKNLPAKTRAVAGRTGGYPPRTECL